MSDMYDTDTTQSIEQRRWSVTLDAKFDAKRRELGVDDRLTSHHPYHRLLAGGWLKPSASLGMLTFSHACRKAVVAASRSAA